MERRKVFQLLGYGMASVPFMNIKSLTKEDGLSILKDADPSDEKYWREFSKQYYKTSDLFINLENGYFGVQPIPVIEAYQKNIQLVNEWTSKFMRQQFYRKYYPEAMEMLSEISGADKEELLITRNATEALNILIQGLEWKAGDEVILQHHDYHSMIETFQMLEKRLGIVIKYIDVPLLPKNQEEVVRVYREAITSKTRCILITHLTHLTGQILPVKAACDIAKSRGIEVIVDAAHSFTQMDYKLKDLNADFIGVNLHKWYGNPLGAGLLYIQKDRIKDIKPLYGDTKKTSDDIRKLGHYGTPAAPVVMCITIAGEFNKMVTIKNKEGRLRYLKNYWTTKASQIDRVTITTPLAKDMSCALASFKIDGVTAETVVKKLDEKHNVFTVIRKLHNETVVRVTPNLYNTTQDLNRLLEGIESIVRG